MTARPPREDRVRRVAAYIETHADETLTLARLGRIAALSGPHLQRRFKASFGISPKAFQDAVRLRRLKAGRRATSA